MSRNGDDGDGGPLISIDEALDRIDFGDFQTNLIVLIGLSIACDGLEVGLVAYLQECIKAEWHLDGNMEALLTSAVLVGQILGMLFSPLADTYGRRPGTALPTQVMRIHPLN